MNNTDQLRAIKLHVKIPPSTNKSSLQLRHGHQPATVLRYQIANERPSAAPSRAS